MKAKRFIAVFCVGLSVLLCVLTIGAIFHLSAQATVPAQMLAPAMVGTIANGAPQFGSSSAALVVSSGSATAGAGVFSFANTGSYSLTGSTAGTITLTGGTGSIPCYGAVMTLTSSNALTGRVLIGSTSSSCAFPVYNTSAGSTGTAYIPLPQLTNINQLYMSLTPSGTGTVATATVDLIYTQ